ncbi:MAG: hypothetical protein SGJ27_17105 [Candidatus Melainabacteria bacterium]|nr:hypothetical protein [Candidatus Melainabacteria bacterium]
MKLLICQSCGVIIRTKGKHCTGCGIQLALNTPTQMDSFSQIRPPLAVSIKQDHLLLERVVTERQLNVMTLRPQIGTSAGYDDGGEDHGSGGGNGGYGGYGENGGNGGNGGYGGNGGNGGNGGSTPYSQLDQDPSSLTSGFGWNSASSSTMSPAEGRYVDPNSSGQQWSSSNQGQAQQEPAAPGSMYAPSGNGDSYQSSARDSVQLVETAELVLPPNKAVEALSEMVFEDSASGESPQIETPTAHDYETAKVEEPAPEVRPQPVQQASPTMHLAGFGAHPGAAISIAIGAGVGAIANQMLTKRSSGDIDIKTQDSATSQPVQPVAAPVSPPVVNAVVAEAPVNEVAPEENPSSGAIDNGFQSRAFEPEQSQNPLLDSGDSGLGGSSSGEAPIEDFFAAKQSELEDFFGPQSRAEPPIMEMGDPAAEMGEAARSSGLAHESASPIAHEEPSPIAAEKPALAPVAQPSSEPRLQSTNFFGEDEGFDFFSKPASASANRPVDDDLGDDFAPRASSAPAPVAEPTPQPKLVIPASETVESAASDRPRVAMPKSVTQSRPKIKGVDEESTELPKVKKDTEDKTSDDDNDDDDEEKEKYKPPARRNFSGDSSAKNTRSKPAAGAGAGAIKASGKGKKTDDENDDDDADSTSGGALGWLEEEVGFAGLNVSRKTAGVLIGVGIFILVQIPGWFMSVANIAGGGAGGGQTVAQSPQAGAGNPFGGGMGQPGGGMPGGGMPGGGMPGGMPMPGQLPGQAGMPGQGMPGGGMPGQAGAPQGPQATFANGVPVVGGQWMIEVLVGNQPFPGQIQLQQNGTSFAGLGKDASGTFDIQGQLLPPDQMQFSKRYDQESRHKYQAHNEYIIFQGKLIPEGGAMTAVGVYQTQKKIGSSFSTLKPTKVVPIKGPWRAKQSVVVAASPQVPIPGGFQLPAIGGGAINTESSMSTNGKPDLKKMQNLGLLAAFGFVGVGILIFLFFLGLFGPSGKMNIWEKQKYIPSQFRPEHMKMVREFAKPLTAGGTPFGQRDEWRWWTFWQPRFMSLPPDVREHNPHMLFIGGGDKGKTRLMASMITHDIKSEDRAVVIIDSDGQLCDLIVNWISSQPDGSKYAKRVVLVDPTYKAGSLAYNPLEMPADGDLQSASSAIVHGFKAIYTEPPGAQSQWNAQTANILRNAALLLMANGKTLTDLPNLLQDNDFRDIMLEAVERRKQDKTEYITILETWNQYKKLARTDQWINWVEPILNRVGPMLSDGRIRPILTKPVSDLKLGEIIRDKKILIVKVPQGELDQNANLLGSLIVTGLQQAAMSMAKANVNSKHPCALYLDEMDSFIEKETIENITGETRRYQIGFCGAIKTFQHLPEDYRNQLVINMGTMAIFALSKKDGDMLGPQMFRVDGRKIKHQTIQNFFNQVNTSPQFELIMDEEKLNIDRIVGQEIQGFFCYRVGTVAGVFKLKAFDFKDIPEKKINRKLIEKMHAITDSFGEKKSRSRDKDDDRADA